MHNIGKLDLNLLRTLDVLLDEYNVTRAAQRLHLAQPSVSVHLAKLREFFEDPLLLPGPRGMRPTAKAEQLREPLRHALETLGMAIAPTTAFAPGEAQLTWRVAATDYAESTILLPALAELSRQAPKARLAVLEMAPTRIAAQLERGELDLAFHTLEGAPPGLRHRLLFSERYVLAGRAGHPALRRRPSLAQFCKLRHVLVSPDGGGFHGITDTALQALGLQRQVALSVPHFLFVMAALASTDLVALLPARLVQGNSALQWVEPPVKVPGYQMTMLWHERYHRDPGHVWLRELIAQCLA